MNVLGKRDKRGWRLVCGDDAKRRKSYREQRRKGDHNDAHRNLRHKLHQPTRSSLAK